VVGALKLARARPELRRIVTVVCDNGLRYLSTELCGPAETVEVPDREHPTSAVDQQNWLLTLWLSSAKAASPSRPWRQAGSQEAHHGRKTI
jgi:hypothetical protein